MEDPVQKIRMALHAERQLLLNHEVYTSVQTLEDLRVFMQHHIFAVWDFMSLLKTLQRELTCVTVPWIPKGIPEIRRLINEMVLEEETEVDLDEQPASFFELYLRAMDHCEADTSSIRELWEMIATGKTIEQALVRLRVAGTIRHFLSETFSIIREGRVHEVAAALTLGREDIIPGMFKQMVKDLDKKFPEMLHVYTFYIDRHAHMYQAVHMPLAEKMLRDLCGSDVSKWQDCEAIARRCMAARLELWNGVMHEIRNTAALNGTSKN